MRVILDTENLDPSALDATRLIRYAPRHRSVCGHLVAEVEQVTTEQVTCQHCSTWLAGYKHALGLADD